MFHYDAFKNPTAAQQGLKDGAKKPSQKGLQSHQQHQMYLETHPYNDIDENELVEVCQYYFCLKYCHVQYNTMETVHANLPQAIRKTSKHLTNALETGGCMLYILMKGLRVSSVCVALVHYVPYCHLLLLLSTYPSCV